jgi:parallel beta-helix repeat protein
MRLSVLIAVFITCFVIAGPTGGTTWQAYNDSTLNEIVSAAQENDAIYLNPGTYTVAVDLNKDGLSLVGPDPTKVTFDLSNSNLKISSENCTIRGITVINSAKGIVVTASNGRIRDCIFDGLTDNTGLYIQGDNVIFEKNLVTNCTGTYFAVYGVEDNCVYRNNTFTNNSCAGLGLYLGSGSNVISNNVFSMNKYGMYLWYAGSGNSIYLNDFIENTEDIKTKSSSSVSWNSPVPLNYTYKGMNFNGYLGNYWDTLNGSDSDFNGILDTSNDNGDVGIDYYPLAIGFEAYVGTDDDTTPADLVATSLSVSSLLVAEQPNRIKVNVSNVGGADAEPFKAILYDGDDVLNEQIVLSLDSGSSTQIVFTLMPPEGQLDLKVVIDTENNVDELFESNNEVTGSVTSETVEIDENWFQFHKDVEHIGYYPGEAPDDSTLFWVSDDIDAVGGSSPVIGNGTVFINCGDSVMDSPGDEDDQVIGLDMYTGEVVGSFGPGSTSWASWASPCYYNGNVSCGRSDSVNGCDMIVNGRRYVGDYSGGKYHCTYECNGTEIWNKSVIGYAQGTPAYSDGMVYLTSCEHMETGDVYCVDADTGEEIWHIAMPYRQTAAGTPSVYNDILYFTTYYWQSDEEEGYIYAVDKSDGTVIWRQSIERTDSCPACAYGKVYVCGGCPGYSKIQTYCFDALTGELVWETLAEAAGIGGWTCSPLVADNKVFVGRIDSTMYSYDYICAFGSENGALLWSAEGGGSTPAMAEGILYTVGNDGRVYAYGVLEEDDWNPWNDPDSDGGETVTMEELFEAISCWKYGDVLTTNVTVDLEKLFEVISFWRYG